MGLESQFHLLKSRRFLPLFITQFLGAFNDNVYKNALIILISYKLIVGSVALEQFMATLAGGLFILPFFLFSATAGQLADKYDKSRIIIAVKFCEIAFMLLAAIGFYLNSITLLLITLFLMGTHSSFFGPVKYAILPDHLHQNELIGGNALIEGGTFISILLGTLISAFLVTLPNGPSIVSTMAVAVAIAGFTSSLFVPHAMPANHSLKINWNFIQETFAIIKNTRKEKNVFLCILGISWFWLVGFTFLTQIANFTKNSIHADEDVVKLFLTTFTLGIALGSLACNKLLKGEISAKYIPVSILVMTVFIIDLYFAGSSNVAPSADTLFSLSTFLQSANHWRILFDMFMIAASGGIYAVPLYTIMQTQTAKEHRARTIACNNILNAVFMVVASVVTILLFAIKLSLLQVFLILGIANAFVALYICKLLPDAVIKSFVKWLLQALYQVQVTGLENYKNAGDRVVIIANHTSFLDVALLVTFLPDKLTFAINTHIAQTWWVKPFLKLVQVFEIDHTNPMATKLLIRAVKGENRKCVIFPEGRLTTTGGLMKIYEGPGLVADHADAALLPIRIEGAQYTPFSRLRGKVKIHWFPKISLTILPPKQFDISPAIKGRHRRHLISLQLYDIMTDMMFTSSNYKKTLFESLIEARHIHKGRRLILEDTARTPINYNQLIMRSFILGGYVRRVTQPNETVGILLPNTISTVITFFAMQLYGRVPGMLNFSAGAHNLLLACQIAKIKLIYTAHKFIEAAHLEETITKLTEAGIKIIYLEDLREQIAWHSKLLGLLKSKFAHFFYIRSNPQRNTQKPAVVLFTSGSEGIPKGVALSHENIQANRFQLNARVDLTPQDTIFNAMPLFHAFGLTAGTLLPIFSGMKLFLYPSPLHYRIIPEIIYEYNASITFATDTFLHGYGRFAHPYDFYKIRYVFAGAEKLKQETRALWMEKFGVRILEGYGITEASPILSVSTSMQNKPGTVGRFLPGIAYKLEPVPGIATGGRLFVSGPNIMLGYLSVENPGEIIAPENGWHDTGDIVEIDEYGFITIKDRAKRFAKIGGEMVSLTAVENHIYELWPETHHAVVTVPDTHKGEQLVLITENQHATREQIIAHFKAKDIAELNLPRKILFIDKVPLLPTGKVNYPAVKEWLAHSNSK